MVSWISGSSDGPPENITRVWLPTFTTAAKMPSSMSNTPMTRLVRVAVVDHDELGHAAGGRVAEHRSRSARSWPDRRRRRPGRSAGP